MLMYSVYMVVVVAVSAIVGWLGAKIVIELLTGADESWDWVYIMELVLLVVMCWGFLGAWNVGMTWRMDFEDRGCTAFCRDNVAQVCGKDIPGTLDLENGTWKRTYPNQSNQNQFYPNQGGVD